jgi:hypothetical protein
VDSVAASRRQARFDSELERARLRWEEKPDLGNCADILREKADAELCPSAASALAAVEQLEPAAAPDSALPVLANGALALVRLLERARYLNFQELGQRSLEGDAGAPSAAASAGSRAASPTASTHLRALKAPRALHGLSGEHAAVKLSDSPLSHLVENNARLEQDVLRELAAYLEYGELPVREAALTEVRRIQSEHVQWSTLNHVLREAMVLESDVQQKRKLSELAALGLPRGKRPDQPTGSK